MKAICTFLFLLTTISSCKSHSEDSAYKIINQIYLEKESSIQLVERPVLFLNNKQVLESFFTLDLFNEKLSTYNLGSQKINLNITQSELSYMEKQISETKTDRFNKSFLSDKIVLVEKNKVEGTRNKKNLFPKMPLYEISKPLFSKSGHIALLYEEVHCGIECGGAQVIILVKNDDLWNQVGTIPISLR